MFIIMYLQSTTFVHEGLRAVRVSTSNELNSFTNERPPEFTKREETSSCFGETEKCTEQRLVLDKGNSNGGQEEDDDEQG